MTVATPGITGGAHLRRPIEATTYAALAGALIGAAFVIGAPSAQAAERDGICQTTEFCLYYNSGHQGSVSDFKGDIINYGSWQPECYEFKSAGAGQGLCVKNNAASVWNRTSAQVTVYANSGYKGAIQAFAPGEKINLNATLKNQNASHQFATAPKPPTAGPPPAGTVPPGVSTIPPPVPPTPDPPLNDEPGGTVPPGVSTTAPTKMSSVLYNRNVDGCRVTAGFDGYENIDGKHEGIDFRLREGAPVHALVKGRVINVVHGARGGAPGSLSTIAIYNAARNKRSKTIIYLHATPLKSLVEGQSVSPGQRIATESWRGISDQSSAHTHVEMRRGYETRAAKSVGTTPAAQKLDNPDPTTFWNRLGYSIC